MTQPTDLIVITGGTKGIGKALIHRFAKGGFDIATCSRNQAELTALKTDVEQAYGVQVTTLPADMSVPEQVVQFADCITSLGKPVAALINNSGRFLPGGVLTAEPGYLEEMIDTNLYSAYHLIRALVPSMVDNKRGHVFNICSTASFLPYEGGACYAISKFAMFGMSKALREELMPHGVKVSSVMPGPTMSASWEGVDIPEQRFIDPDDIAELIFSTYQLGPRTVVEDLIIRPQLGDL